MNNNKDEKNIYKINWMAGIINITVWVGSKDSLFSVINIW
jgi:hypothetical protein